MSTRRLQLGFWEIISEILIVVGAIDVVVTVIGSLQRRAIADTSGMEILEPASQEI